MGSSESKQKYTPNPVSTQEIDPAVKQFLQNLSMFTNVVCQQPNPQSASGTGVNNPNTVVFYPVEHNTHSDMGPYAQSPYAQSPYAQSPYAQSPYAQSPYAHSRYYDEPSIIVFETENYQNSHDTLNYGTVKDTWKKQPKYSL
jgi:hypothetical protein